MKVILLMTITLDGRIALDSEHKADWSEKADKKIFVELTKRAGVIIMGSRTYDTIGSPLSGRKNIVLTRDKSRASTEANLVFTDQTPAEIVSSLEKEGFEEAVLIGGQSVNTLFAQVKLIDQIVVTISPLVFGRGLSLFDETISMHLRLQTLEKLGDNSLIASYAVLK